MVSVISSESLVRSESTSETDEKKEGDAGETGSIYTAPAKLSADLPWTCGGNGRKMTQGGTVEVCSCIRILRDAVGCAANPLVASTPKDLVC